MSNYSNIEWCDCTWNPATGCTKVSKACKNCYMFRDSLRLQWMENIRYINGHTPTMHWDLIDLPRTWKKPRNIFVCSMSDLFHDEYPLEFIQSVFKTMNETPQHIYRVLTKRSPRLAEIADELTWSDNIWIGVSVEDNEVYIRIDDLRKVQSNNRWLSIEPLLDSVSDIDLTDIRWAVVGGESGPDSRPMKIEWVREIRDLCEEKDIAFFFKQYGKKFNNPDLFDDTMYKKIDGTTNPLYAKGGCLLDGKIYQNYPNN